MLQIGINEGYKIGPNCKISEKGGFELQLVQGEVITSALELLESEDPEAENGKIMLFPPNMKEYKTEAPKEGIDLVRDLKVEYKRMYTIFNLYFPKEDLNKKYPMKILLEGLTITPENEKVMFMQESVINKMFKNFAEATLKFINEEKLWEKEAFRIKLLRQSTAKAFPTLTRKPEYGDWIELCSIPLDQTKVKFTPYEISKGYNDPTIPTDIVITDGESAFNDLEETGPAVSDAPAVSFD